MSGRLRVSRRAPLSLIAPARRHCFSLRRSRCRCPRIKTVPAGGLTSRRKLSHFDERHFRNDAAPRRTAITATARRFPFRRRAPLGFGAAGLRQLLRPRLDRPVRVIEAELAVAGFVSDDDDTDMAAALEPAEQNLVCKRLLDV